MNDWGLKRPLIIAHRGASADAPENTMAAFSLALEHEADGFELDVQLSSDGELVVFHDYTVGRMTNGKGRVSDLTLKQLQALDMPEDQRIPTLRELFDRFGNEPLYNIEIKVEGDSGGRIETAVVNCIQSYSLENRVLVSSFNHSIVRHFRQLLPEQIPVALIYYDNSISLPDDNAQLYLADHPYYKLVNEEYMRWAEKLNIQVNVWTVDDVDYARRLVGLGVQGLITNKPKYMRQNL